MADRNQFPRTVASITGKGCGSQPHACDDPSLSPKEFLLAVMHDTTQPLSIRIKAARDVAPYILPPPRPVAPISCTIVIPSHDEFFLRQGQEPRTLDHGSVAEDPEQINGNSQSFSVGAINNHQPQSEPPAPQNLTTTPDPVPLPDYSTPPTPAELQLAADHGLEPRFCACGHWQFGPCPLGDRCREKSTLN